MKKIRRAGFGVASRYPDSHGDLWAAVMRSMRSPPTPTVLARKCNPEWQRTPFAVDDFTRHELRTDISIVDTVRMNTSRAPVVSTDEHINALKRHAVLFCEVDGTHSIEVALTDSGIAVRLWRRDTTDRLLCRRRYDQTTVPIDANAVQASFHPGTDDALSEMVVVWERSIKNYTCKGR